MRISAFASGVALEMSTSRSRFHTDIFVSGSSMSLVTLSTKFSSDCEPSARK